MPLKNKLQIGALVMIGLLGAYLILTSGRFQIELYSLILTVLVGGFILYLYFLYSRKN